MKAARDMGELKYVMVVIVLLVFGILKSRSNVYS
jgi:hypothetical protein